MRMPTITLKTLDQIKVATLADRLIRGIERIKMPLLALYRQGPPPAND